MRGSSQASRGVYGSFDCRAVYRCRVLVAVRRIGGRGDAGGRECRTLNDQLEYLRYRLGTKRATTKPKIGILKTK